MSRTEPNIPMPVTNKEIEAMAITGRTNSDSGIRGCCAFRSTAIKSKSKAVKDASAIAPCWLDKPLSAIQPSASKSVTSKVVNTVIPAMSNRWIPASVRFRAGKALANTYMPIAPTGRLTKKSQRHESLSATQPPSTGPKIEDRAKTAAK